MCTTKPLGLQNGRYVRIQASDDLEMKNLCATQLSFANTLISEERAPQTC